MAGCQRAGRIGRVTRREKSANRPSAAVCAGVTGRATFVALPVLLSRFAAQAPRRQGSLRWEEGGQGVAGRCHIASEGAWSEMAPRLDLRGKS